LLSPFPPCFVSLQLPPPQWPRNRFSDGFTSVNYPPPLGSSNNLSFPPHSKSHPPPSRPSFPFSRPKIFQPSYEVPAKLFIVGRKIKTIDWESPPSEKSLFLLLKASRKNQANRASYPPICRPLGWSGEPPGTHRLPPSPHRVYRPYMGPHVSRVLPCLLQ